MISFAIKERRPTQTDYSDLTLVDFPAGNKRNRPQVPWGISWNIDDESLKNWQSFVSDDLNIGSMDSFFTLLLAC